MDFFVCAAEMSKVQVPGRSRHFGMSHKISIPISPFPPLTYIQICRSASLPFPPMRFMTTRELRNLRREAERKAKKLAYQESRNPASASESNVIPGEPCSSALAPNPDLLDEFSAGEQTAMAALRARVHARSGLARSQKSTPPPTCPAEPNSGPTGPRTVEGKTASSGNSLKHGLASCRVIIPGEDPADFEALLADLIAEHTPATQTEALLVQQMAQSWWLTQRAVRIQNQAFTETRVDTHQLALFLRYQTTHEHAFYRALNSLIKLQKERRKAGPEFVSQTSVGAMHASPVSQKSYAKTGFVSQKTAKAAPISSSAAPQFDPASPFRPAATHHQA